MHHILSRAKKDRMNTILVFPSNCSDVKDGFNKQMFFVLNLCIAFQGSGGVNRDIRRIHIAVFQTDERAQSAN